MAKDFEKWLEDVIELVSERGRKLDRPLDLFVEQLMRVVERKHVELGCRNRNKDHLKVVK